MNKQEVMKILTDTKHDYEFCWSDDFRTGFIEGINCSLKAINQLDEPEKPILTKEEAEWLEGLKEARSKLPKIQLIYFIVRQGWGYLFEYKEGYEEANHVLKPQLYPDEVYPPDLKERLLNAVLYGYEVEKKKLYTVEIPNPNGGTYLALCKDVDGKLFFDAFFSEEWKTFGKCKLTESEIKEGFAWAWQFAKEVEDD